MSETVLLAGGAGFIGSHIAQKYVEKGYHVVIVDDLSTGNKTNIAALLEHPNVHFYQCSILDQPRLQAIFSEHQPQIINNHAAQKSVPDSVHDPMKDLNINIVGLLNLIECARQFKVQKFLSASSGGALSKAILFDGDTSKETDAPCLSSPYAMTKFMGEQYATFYAGLYGFQYVGLRYANVFGPRQVADGDCGVVPIFVHNIMNKKDSILMTYDDMPLGCTRDYIFVDDVVDCNVLATMMPLTASGVYNIGSEQEISMQELFDILSETFESDTKLLRRGPRAGDIRRSVLNCQKAWEQFQWKATMTFAEGARRLASVIQAK